MESFFQDVRFSIRNLRRRPGFLVAALLTLTLGIGGTTTIFTVVNGALLRPLPYSDPDELVMVWERADAAGYPKVPLADADFVDYRERIRTLSQMAMFGYQGSTLTGLGDPAFIQSSQVSPALFPMLGVEAILGRTFTPDEEEPGHEAAAVLSHAFWQERFGGEESALGTTIELNGRPYTVVGVLPPSFLFPPPVSFLGQTLAGRIELFTPMVMDPEGLRRGNHSNMTIGRIAEGYSIGQVDAEVANIAAGLAAEYPDELSGVGAWVTPLRRQSVELVRTTIVLLLAAVSLVLLIACANVANLLLARAGARRREMAVRLAVGAGRGRVIRQLLTESLLLAAAGGVLGLLFALWGTHVLASANPMQLPSMYAPRLEWLVLLFAAAIVAGSSVLFGLAPALQASRTDLRTWLQEGMRAAGSRSQNRAKRLLVVLETALAVLVLVGAGLTLRSFAALQQTDPGFEAENLLTFPVVLPEARYPEQAQQTAFFDQLVERIGALPGVMDVSATTALPFNFDISGSGYFVEGEPLPEEGWPQIAMRRVVMQGCFDVMGIPILRGRDFTQADEAGGAPAAIVNQAFARLYSENGDIVGRRITWDDPRTDEEVVYMRVVGVVGDTRYLSMKEPDDPAVYLPFAQWTDRYLVFAARTAVPPDELTEPVRSAIWELDPLLPVEDTLPMTERISDASDGSRYTTLLFALFGGAALVLAAVGLYGVVSFTVGQQVREIGIRMAFGARPDRILLAVLKDGVGLALLGVGAGLVAGLLASVAFTAMVSSMVYEVAVLDPITYLMAPIALVAVATLAALFPALRAMRLTPTEALRYE